MLPGQTQRSYVEAVYDCENRTVAMIDPLGHYLVREYDRLGRLTADKVYTGEFGSGTLYAATSYTYSYADQVLTVKDPQNHTTVYSYDFLGRVTQVTAPDSTAATFSYDDTYNRVISTSGRRFRRICWFDWLSRLVNVEEEYEASMFAVTTYDYDEVSNLVSFTDAEGRTTNYTYSSFFGLTRTTHPDSTYEEYAYNNGGNIVSYTDANGNETTYTYDSLHRLAEIEYEDQSTVSFIYDLNSNRIKMDDDAPNTGDYAEYSYDEWNRLITETRHILQNTYTVFYQYDTGSRLTKLTYPDNMQVLYFYDDLNRLTEINRYVDGADDEILMDGVQYNTESLLTQFDYGNDMRATLSYDSRHRILTFDIKNGEISYLDLDYTWDKNSNITQLVNGWRDTNSIWHSDTEFYSYDGLDRLTSASCTFWSHTYSYDRVGNRTAKDGTTYTINAVNEVTELSDGTSFNYDSNGNMIGKTTGTDTWEYTYDYANELVRARKNGTTSEEYGYDGDGRRIQVTENNVTTYIFFGLDVLYEENTTGTASYIYGPTGKLAKKTTIQGEPHTFYYHQDHLGSTRLVTDESATVVLDAVYEPFGESTATGEESYLYTGKEKDATGLYYYGARYYDPGIGRFITRDLLAGEKVSPQSLNLYTYCLNNPVKLIDPEGMFYKMCLEDGSCLWVWESTGAWVAKDASGKTITDSSDINSMIAQGMILEAIVKILQIFGFTVSEDDIHYEVEYSDILEWEKSNILLDIGYIQFDHNGTTIRWDIKIYFGDPRGFGGYALLYEDGSISASLTIARNSRANVLLLAVGHECVHVNQYLSGQWARWVKRFGFYGANALSEMGAYYWNIQWGEALFPALIGEFKGRYKEYTAKLRATRIRRPFPI